MKAYDPEDLILDCYRLAQYYGLEPDIFLSKPLSVVKRHRYWTGRLEQLRHPPEEDE